MVIETFDELLGREPDGDPCLSFATYDAVHRTFTPKRMQILGVMSGAGPLSRREVARRVGRDFKGVHTDLTELIRAGLIKKTSDDRVIFPYSGIHFDFELEASSAA